MLPTFTCSSHKLAPSSRLWLKRQFGDPYVRKRLSHPASYRSRSAFKLIELHNKWGRFLHHEDVKRVVDLGAAPGGWSQVIAGKMGWVEDEDDDWVLNGRRQVRKVVEGDGWGLTKRKKLEKIGTWSSFIEESLEDELSKDDEKFTGRGQIVAVDLLRIEPISGVQTLQADFLSDDASVLIKGLLMSDDNPEGKADVILSDMAANMSGNMIHDSQSSLTICEAVMQFTLENLRTAQDIGRKNGGVLLLKHFSHPLLQEFRLNVLEPTFRSVMYGKPDSSRDASSEGYWICRGFKGTRS